MILLNLSLKFKLKALGDFGADLGKDLLDLVLCSEFALFEFGL